MNEPEKDRIAQRARNYERQAKTENTYAAWMKAADEWRKIGDKESMQRCIYSADMCKK
jgi:deoxyadenosine/deoxycytidine kinase